MVCKARFYGAIKQKAINNSNKSNFIPSWKLGQCLALSALSSSLTKKLSILPAKQMGFLSVWISSVKMVYLNIILVLSL